MADNTAYQDLLKDTSESKEDGNYFIVTITDLKPNTAYPVQFRWIYKDNRVNKVVSPVKLLITPGESQPNTPGLDPSKIDVSQPEKIIITWDGTSDDPGSPEITNYERIEVYIDGAPFDGTKPAAIFTTKGKYPITAPAGTYIITLYAVSKGGKISPVSNPVTVQVTAIGEVIESPTNPTGFSIDRILGGIEVSWAGTYANGTFSGFKAVKIYVGNSPSATPGTYQLAGVMTGDKLKNSIVIPVDGTYLNYDTPVYIHAAAINKNDVEGTLQQNVASNSLGARTAISSDLANQIITNAKLVNDAVTEVKIATSAITETKIASDAITTPKIAAGAISTAKLAALAITAEKIAADAITATKIKAGEIDVTKLSAGTISVNNLEAGTLKTTSYIRAGSNFGGARIDISPSSFSGVPAGFYIYDSVGNPVLSAPLGGGLSIVGSGSFTGSLSIGSSPNIFRAEPSIGIWLGGPDGSYANSYFSVSNSGVLKAVAGTIGGWTLGGTYLQGNNIKLDRSQIIIGSTSSSYLDMTPTSITHRYSYGAATGNFTLDLSTGVLTTQNAQISGTVYAQYGTIGGWTIGPTSLYSGSTYLYSNGTISGAAIVSGSINVTGVTIPAGSSDSESGGGGTEVSLISNAFSTLYSRAPFGGYSAINCVGFNAIALISTNSAGVVSSWYPYYDGAADLGVKYSSTYNTYPYRWRNLRLTGDAYFGGDGYTNNIDYTTIGGAVTKIYSDGRIYANSLGGTSSNGQGAIYQDSTGYLRVRSGTGSSRNIKDNIELFTDISNYSQIINSMELVTFNYKPEIVIDPEIKQLGMIVEDLIQHTDNEFLIEYKNNEPSGIHYDKIPLFLVGAFQEMTKKIEDLQQRLDALEG